MALVLEDGRVTRVRKRARVAVAETRQVVLVAAEGLGHGLGFEGTVAVVDHTPNHIVLEHI